MKRRGLGFTLIELMVVISIIVILLAVLLPALGVARVLVRKGSNKSQIRGIVMQLTTFANSNKEWYPGLNSDGGVPNDLETKDNINGVIVTSVTQYSNRQSAFTRLAFENFISEKTLKSPGETDPKVFHPDVDELFTYGSGKEPADWSFFGQDDSGVEDDGDNWNDTLANHGSYAILEYWDNGTEEDKDLTMGGTNTELGGYYQHVGEGLTNLGKLEWRLTGSPTAIIVADRHNMIRGTTTPSEARRIAKKRSTDAEDQGALIDGVQLSYWSKDKDWYEGALGFNDGHVEDISKPGMPEDADTTHSTGIEHDARYGAAGSATGIRKIDHLFRWDPAVIFDPEITTTGSNNIYEQNFIDEAWVGDGRLVSD